MRGGWRGEDPDPGRFTQALETERVQAHIYELRQRFQGRKVMLGVDRLDMIKGIPQKLLGFEKFLSEHPEWRDRVLLARSAVHSRPFVYIRVHSIHTPYHHIYAPRRIRCHASCLLFSKKKDTCFSNTSC